MPKRGAIIITIMLVSIFVFLIIRAAMKPESFVWYPSFRAYDRQPYGAYVFFDQLENMFPGKKVKRFGQIDFEHYYSQVYDAELLYDDSDYNEETDESWTIEAFEKDQFHSVFFLCQVQGTINSSWN